MKVDLDLINDAIRGARIELKQLKAERKTKIENGYSLGFTDKRINDVRYKLSKYGMMKEGKS